MLPVFVTVTVTVTVPRRDTLGVTESPPVVKVVYESPNPNGYRGL